MKIAILSGEAMALRQTGDWMQARKTSVAMKSIGVNVRHYVYGAGSNQVDLPEDVVRIDSSQIPMDVDVLHFISSPSAIQLQGLLNLRNRKAPLIVGSTIFWRSLTHHRTVYQNGGPLKKFCKAATIDILSNITKPIRHYEAYDLLLPNSQTEIKQVRKYCKLKSNAVLISVPNAIDPVPDWALQCPAPEAVDGEDYIVYPGVFAIRKNQLGFIKAIRDTDMNVVFMGGAMAGTPSSKEYMELCQQSAPAHWVFLGQIEHGSREFYGALSNARVACLASSCETPGIALLEASSLGVRPVVTLEGGTFEYYGFDGEYLNPLSRDSIVSAVQRAWNRGRLSTASSQSFSRFTWVDTAQMTVQAYEEALNLRGT